MYIVVVVVGSWRVRAAHMQTLDNFEWSKRSCTIQTRWTNASALESWIKIQFGTPNIQCHLYFWNVVGCHQMLIHIEHLQLMTTMDSFESLSALAHDLRHCANWRIGWRGSIHWKPGVPPSDHHGDRPGSKFTCWNTQTSQKSKRAHCSCEHVQLWCRRHKLKFGQCFFRSDFTFVINTLSKLNIFSWHICIEGSQQYQGTVTIWFHALGHVL